MKTKRYLKIALFFVVFATSLAIIASCSKKEPTPTIPTEYGEAGTYYYDAAGGREYFLTLSGGSFTLSLSDSTKKGSYAYNGSVLTMTFAKDAEGTPATLTNGVLSFEYEGNSYRFLKRQLYKVTYNTGGGSEIDPASVLNGRTVSKPQTPTKDGHSFIAWYEDSAFTKPFLFDGYPITKDTTIYARFEKSNQTEFEVNFVLGHDGDAIPNRQTAGGIVYELPEPEIQGQKFVGWWVSHYEDVNKLTYQYTDQQLAENTTLYAVWESSNAPVISVTETGITWAAPGAVNNYTVTITSPDGKSADPYKGTGTALTYSFATRAKGEYKIEVSIDGKGSTTAYYNNKVLDRVSVFEVLEPSLLLFNPVAGAEEYIITVNCGDTQHAHEFNNGDYTYFYFENCQMKKGGITFTVEARAAGFVSSVSREFTFDRTLSQVTGLTVDEATEHVFWNKVNNATSYIIKVVSGGSEYTFDVGALTSFSLKEFSGDLTIKVSAVTKGYNASDAAEVTYSKVKLATPVNIRVTDDVVSWDEVEGASKYNVKIGATIYETQTHTLTLTQAHLSGGTDYVLSVQALGASTDKHSLFSDEITVKHSAMGAKLSYNKGEVSWQHVIGATGYGVKVNNGEEISVQNGKNKQQITLTKAGNNTVSVRFYDADGQPSSWVSTEVFAYTVYFDARGGSAVTAQVYKAKGDIVTLPQSTYEGFTLGGWYNIPSGAKGHGARYEDGFIQGNSDIIAYANWAANPYTAILMVDGEEYARVTVFYRENFVLPVANSNNASKSFDGWYSQPNKNSIEYTNADGISTSVWNDTQDRTLHAVWDDGMEFRLLNDGTYSVRKGAGINNISHVIVPVEYNGAPVSVVGSFASSPNLVKISIPDTIQIIEDPKASFQFCHSLQDIIIYEVQGNHEKLYEDADGVLIYKNKDGNNSKKELNYFPNARSGVFRVPDEVEVLPTTIFANSKLTEVYIPTSVTQIHRGAFRKSVNLYKVEFDKPISGAGESLSIATLAFEECTSLTEITLPARLESLDIEMFYKCTKLSHIYIDEIDGVTRDFADKDGVVTTGDGKKIVYVPKGRSGEFIIPAGVEVIGAKAFEGCIEITKLTIPAFVTTIEKEAFKGLTKLNTLIFDDELTSTNLNIGESAFYSARELTEVTLPAHLVSLGKYAFGDTAKLNTVYVNSSGINNGGKLAFEALAFAHTNNNAYVVNLYLGAEVPAINVSEVFGGTRLANVVVDPDNAEYASDDGVLYDKNLTSIVYYPLGKTGDFTIPDTVTTIGGSVFEKTNITKITISNSVTYIGTLAFNSCTRLTEVIFETGGTEDLIIADNAFEYCTQLTEIELPVRVKKIGNNAFESCSNLQSISLPEGLEEIGERAFFNCSKLITITIPSTVQKMGGYSESGDLVSLEVFNGCSALTEINVAAGNANFASYDGVLYRRIGGVARELIIAPNSIAGVVDILETTTKIWDRAFQNRKLVTDVTFSQGLAGALQIGTTEKKDDKDVDSYVFAGASNLKSITLPQGVVHIGARAFQDCTSLTEVTIPNTVTYIGYDGFQNCSNLATVIFAEGGELDIVLSDGLVSYQPPHTYYHGVFVGTAIQEVELPERMQTIGMYAFAQIQTLQKVTVPSTVTKISENAFYQTKALNQLIFAPNSQLDTIEKNAFHSIAITQLILPDKLQKIGEYAFSANTKLTKLTIPASVQDIGANAFYGAALLSDIEFAADSNLETIGAGAFQNAVSLQKIAIPASVKVINTSALRGNSNLNTIEFATGNSLTEIKDYAFAETGFTSFTFPESSSGTITLGKNMFQNCVNLTHVHISKSVKDIDNLFAGAPAISSVTVEEGHLYFVQSNDGPFILSNTEEGIAIYYIYQVLPVGQFVIPDGYEIIAARAFENQPNITSVFIPKSVKKIDNYAFANCYNLQTVEFGAGSLLKTLGTYVFQNCISLQSISIPTGVGRIEQYAFDNTRSLAEVILPEGVTYVGNYAFRGTLSLQRINLPTSLIELGGYAFQNSGLTAIDLTSIEKVGTSVFDGNTKLTSITFGGKLSALGTSMFRGTTSLKSVTFHSNLTGIGNNAFQNSGLTSVHVPNLQSFGTNIFNGATELSKVTFDDDIATLGNYMFANTTSLKNITLPSNLTNIGTYTFQNSGLESIVIPVGVTNFGTAVTTNSYVFDGCVNLASVTLHDNLTVMGRNVFSGTKSLKSITLPESLTIVGAYSFQDSALEEVNIPDAVRNIGTYAFSNTPITSMVIPYVTTIGAYAFDGCTELSEVILNDNLTTINSGVFRGTTSLKEITLPSKLGTTGIGSYAFRGSGLTSIVIPTGVRSLGTSVSTSHYTFADCADLESVVFLNHTNFTSLSGYVFSGTTSLKSIELPASLTMIGNYAFLNSGIQNITIPKGVTVARLGVAAFGGTKDLKNFTIHPENTQLTSSDGILYDAADNSIISYASGQDGVVIIRDGVTIKSYAFYGASFVEVVMPSSYEEIPDNFFSGFDGLTSITLPSTLKSIGSSAFADTINLKQIILPEGLESIGANAFQNSGLQSIVIPEGVTSIGNYAFDGTTSLKSVTLPETLETIGTYVFQNSGIESIIIPEGVLSIGNYAFSASALREFTLLSESAVLGTRLFLGCEFLETVNLPDTLTMNNTTSEFNFSLQQTPSLKSIKLPSSMTRMPSTLFQNSGIESIAIPQGIASITANSFLDCTSLKEVTLFEGLTTIALSAFSGNTALETITLPETLTTIGNTAFAECISLNSIVIPESVESMGNNVFRGWTSEQTIYIKKSQFDITGVWNADWANDCEATIVWDYTG